MVTLFETSPLSASPRGARPRLPASGRRHPALAARCPLPTGGGVIEGSPYRYKFCEGKFEERRELKRAWHRRELNTGGAAHAGSPPGGFSSAAGHRRARLLRGDPPDLSLYHGVCPWPRVDAADGRRRAKNSMARKMVSEPCLGRQPARQGEARGNSGGRAEDRRSERLTEPSSRWFPHSV